MNPLDAHPNELAQDILARAVAAALEEPLGAPAPAGRLASGPREQ